jgi:methyl-accepting chemotaxis protein
MTDNQEKQLFKTLETLVSGVQIIQSDVKEIKETLDEHSQILNEHSQILNEHSQILNEHSQILNEHSQILKRLDAKTDSIAETVMGQEVRLTNAEKNIEELRGGIH